MKSLCHQKYSALVDMDIMLKYQPSSTTMRYTEARSNSGKKIQNSYWLIVFSEDHNGPSRIHMHSYIKKLLFQRASRPRPGAVAIQLQ